MEQRIIEQRAQADDILQGRSPGLVAIVGPCSDHKSRRIINEGRRVAAMGSDSLVAIHRTPPWKPRTPRADGSKPWEGLETTNPTATLSRIAWETRRKVSVAIEVGKVEHIERYAEHLTLAWLGARSLKDEVLINEVATNPMLASMPLGVKNNLRGVAGSAIWMADKINRLRSNSADNTSSAVAIFRGGSRHSTPQLWEEEYREALELSSGRLIVDIAHGSEMAHDPTGNFGKSVIGQMACLEHVLMLADKGLTPTGIMIEASDSVCRDTTRQTDPNMPFDRALEGVQELHSIMMSSTAREEVSA